LLLLLSAVSFAQSRTVTGKVTGQEDGASLPGVNVLVKGTTSGAITDASGNFSLAVPGNDAILVFSFIGFRSQEVAVGSRSTINVALAADLQALEEVVVTGYTTENRREVTGAVATVKSKDLVAVPSGNVEQQLQGRVAGVTVITNGQPGTSSVVRVRGFGGFRGNEPLYVIDGVPFGNSNFVVPDDVAETTVLKDAAAASIYGARAANGVIVITTKKGKRDGRLHVNYDGVTGVTYPGKVDNILSPQEGAEWTWQAIRNTAIQQGKDPNDPSLYKHPQFGTDPSGPVLPDYLLVGSQSGLPASAVDLEAERTRYNNDATKGSVYLVMPANKEGTNWWNAITRPAILNRHTLSFSGGTERSNYYVSLAVQDQNGIYLNQNFKRYAFRVNSEHSILRNLRIGENIQTSYISVRGLMGGNGGRNAANDENDVLQAFRMPPLIPVYDSFGGYAGTQAKGFNNPRNPVANMMRNNDDRAFEIFTTGNLYAELDLFKGLTLRSSFGGGFSSFYRYDYNPPQYENSENATSYTYGEGANTFYQWVFTNTARYQKKFGLHGIDVLGGIESLNTGVARGVNGGGLNPAFTDPNFVNLSNTDASGRTVSSNYLPGSTFFSLFGQARYNFNDKYIFTGVLRRDGSSRFAPANRYGVFPAGSVAWRISAEPFMQGLTFIDDLKIRGGYGLMGNSNNVDQNNQFSLYGSRLDRSFYAIGGGNSVTGGFFRSRIGNPVAKWETSVTSNLGFDGNFFKGKLEVVFDIWRKDTRDLLYQLETAAVIGPIATDPAINIAKMRNEGIDLLIVNRGNVTPDLGYELTLNGGFLRNEIVALAPGVDYFDETGARISGPVIRNKVGQPISSFFGYKVIGLFQSDEEVQNSPTQDGKGIGRFRFEDNNGRDENGQLTNQPDGKVDADDRTYLGNPVPKFTGGVNLKLTYRNFELETFMNLALGFQNFNNSKWFTDFYPSFTGAAQGVNVRDSWTFERGGNTVPIYENVSNFSTNTQSTSYYVEQGSYGRLANLQLAYNLPAPLLTRYKIEKVRVYLQATNLFTLSKYSGLDPGVGGRADTTLGIDVGNPPVTQGFNLGLNLGF
jgi:TonB-linked SusC/RagA family outer membrane protein